MRQTGKLVQMFQNDTLAGMSEIDEPVRMTQNGKLVKMNQIDE